MKRIFSFVLVAVLACTGLTEIYAEEDFSVVSAFSEISAQNVSQLNKLILNKGRLGDTYGGSWARFDNIDFGKNGIGSLEINIGVTKQYEGKKLTVHIDELDSPSIAELTVASTGGFDKTVWQQATIYENEITGVHNLYLKYHASGTGDVAGIRMTEFQTSQDYSMPQDISGTENEEAFSVLKALGIIEWDGVSMFGADTEVTAREFVNTVLRFKSVMPEEGDKLLEICGLNGDDAITHEQASKVIIILLNRENVKKADETFYHLLATLDDIKIIGKAEDKLTGGSMLQLLYEVTEAEIMEATGVEYGIGGAYVKYEVRENNTLLSHYRSIFKGEGIVTMDSMTGLDSVSVINDDQIVIDGYLYTLGECTDVDLLGYEVEFYYTHSIDENRLLYIKRTHRAENIVINSNDIVSFKNRVLTYEVENGSQKRVTIPKEAKLIYNGLAAPVYNDELFSIKSGSIEIMRSDGQEIDCVRITSAENYRLAAFSDDVIYLKNTDFVIDLNDGAVECDIIDKYGRPFDVSMLSEDMICTITRAYDMNNLFTYYCVRVSRKNISGMIEAINGRDKKVIISGTEYKWAYSADEAFNELSAGTAIKAYINVYNEIAFAEVGKSTQLLGYLINCYYDDDSESYTVRLYSEKGEHITAKCNEKLNINGVRYEKNEILDELKPGGSVRNELVLFSLNSSGLVTKINFAVENGTGDDDNGLYKYFEGAKLYRKASGSFGGNTLLAGDLLMFIVPENKSAYEDYMISTNNLVDDTTYELICYNREQNKLKSTIAVREYNPDTTADIPNNQDIYYICEIRKGINTNDEVAYILDYYNGQGKTRMSKFVSEGSAQVAEQLKIGDGVKFILNASDEIVGLTRMFSVSDDVIYSGSQVFNALVQIVSGIVYNADGDLIQLEGNDEIFNCASATVYIYDSEKDKITLGSLDDILDYSTVGVNASKAFIFARYSSVRSVVLVK